MTERPRTINQGELARILVGWAQDLGYMDSPTALVRQNILTLARDLDTGKVRVLPWVAPTIESRPVGAQEASP